MYVHTIIYSPTFSCVGGYCPCDTLMCVDIVAGLVVFVVYSFSSLTLDTLYTYMYHVSHCMLNPQFDIGTVQ